MTTTPTAPTEADAQPGTVSTGTGLEPIPTCLTRCCRDWISPFGYPGGSCGLCGERPAFVELLPEDQWVRPAPPIRPEGL